MQLRTLNSVETYSDEPFYDYNTQTQLPTSSSENIDNDVKSVRIRESWVIGQKHETTPIDLFVIDENYEFTSRLLFWITVAELTMGLVYALIALLVISDVYDNNNFLFVVIGAVLATALVLVLHGFANIREFSRSSRMGHVHNRDSRNPFFFGIVTLGIGFFILGRWIWDNCDCCETSDCQPDITDARQVATFYSAWATFLPLDVIWIYTIIRALNAHIYPELKVPTSADTQVSTLPLEIQKEIKKSDTKRAKMEEEGSNMINYRI